MKIFILVLIAVASTILNGCKEHEAPYLTGPGQQYQVKFDFNSFTSRIEKLKSQVKLKAAAATEWPYISDITYFVFDLDGRLLKTQYSSYFLRYPDGTQTKNPNFGIFADTLAGGSYRLVFIAAHDFVEDINGFRYLDYSLHGKNGESLTTIPDIFYRELLLEVQEDTSIDTLTLERMVGSIDVRLTDKQFPANYSKIVWNYTTFNLFHFSENSEQNISRKVELDQDFEIFLHDHEDRWEDTRAFESFVIPDRKTGKLESVMRITALDTEGEIIAYKIIEGIKVKKNKRVVLTGSLFGTGDPSQGFVVKSDSAYSDTEIIGF